jgi:transposase
MIHINKEIMDAWVAGLFEGEGTFSICHNKARGISISSTDLDILQRVQLNYKGTIYQQAQRKGKEHHKIAYVWIVRAKDAIDFLNIIKPFLLSRRKKRAEEWMAMQPLGKTNKNKDIILKLYKEGKTHKEIAQVIGRERSSVTHFLNKHNKEL